MFITLRFLSDWFSTTKPHFPKTITRRDQILFQSTVSILIKQTDSIINLKNTLVDEPFIEIIYKYVPQSLNCIQYSILHVCLQLFFVAFPNFWCMFPATTLSCITRFILPVLSIRILCWKNLLLSQLVFKIRLLNNKLWIISD